MRVLLIDRLGFEKILSDLGGAEIIVPRKLAPGASTFAVRGTVFRGGEELAEYHEVDDTVSEVAQLHKTIDFYQGELRRLESRQGALEAENAQLALELRRKGDRTT